jgi:hypothetical protein
VAHAAQHHHGDDHHRLHQAEGFGRHEALEGREQRARHAAEGGAHAEGQQLEVAGVHAHGLGGDSSSRIAIQARPMRESSRRWQMITVMITSTRNR